MKHYLRNLLIAVDQLVNAALGGWCDETLSARAHRCGWTVREALINALFFDRDHCRNSFVSERIRSQLPKEYR